MDYSNGIDENLFDEIKKDNKLAFDSLFKKYYHQLCYFIESYTKDNYIAEELVADVFTTIWLKRKKINIHVSIKSYLYTSAKNEALMYLRKKRIKTEDLETAKLSIIQEINPEQIMINKEDNIWVNNLLELIPNRCRQVFILHRLDGFKYKAIAEIMSISTKTVENHMGKALKILRKNFNNF